MIKSVDLILNPERKYLSLGYDVFSAELVFIPRILCFGRGFNVYLRNYNNKAIRDGKYLALPHSSAWQRPPIKIEHFHLFS